MFIKTMALNHSNCILKFEKVIKTIPEMFVLKVKGLASYISDERDNSWGNDMRWDCYEGVVMRWEFELTTRSVGFQF